MLEREVHRGIFSLAAYLFIAPNKQGSNAAIVMSNCDAIRHM